MKSRAIAFVLATALALSSALSACGTNPTNNSSNGNDPSSAQVESDEKAQAAPVLDGKWRQVGLAEGAGGIIGTIDTDTIAIWVKTENGDVIYWCGSFEAPKDGNPYSWTSKADKANLTEMLASKEDTKDFSYKDGKLSFDFVIQGTATPVEMEQTSKESGLLTDLRPREGRSANNQAPEIKDLVLSDSCHSIANGNVYYTIAIFNPNKEYAPQWVNVNVSGRTKDGKISFSDDWQIPTTFPDSTTYWSSVAGDGKAS